MTFIKLPHPITEEFINDCYIGEMDRCIGRLVCSNVGASLVCHNDERAGLKGKALDFTGTSYFPALTASCDQKNKIPETAAGNRLPL